MFKLFPKMIMGDSNVTLSNTVIDAATDLAGHVTVAEEDCTITTIAVVLAAKAGTAGTMRFGLQSVGGDGLPTGTWLGSGNGYVDYNDWTVAAGATIVLTLGTSVTLAKGDIFAIVYQATATGTFDGTNNITLRTHAASMQLTSTFPYGVQNTAGTTAKVTGGQIRVFEYRSSSKVYGRPVGTATLTGITQTTTPDEFGIEINIPTTVCSQYKIAGTYFSTTVVANATYEMLLYEGTNVLQTAVIDGDQTARNNRSTFLHFFPEDTLVTLNGGTNYIVAIRPTSANSVERHRFTVDTAGGREAYSDSITIRSATRTDQGAWSYSDTTIEMFQPLVIPVSSGGLLVHPGMAGGMRG